MILVFVGPPGSGKGTVASLFAQKGWVSFSMGQALRDHVKHKGKYSKEVDNLLKNGRLARDKVAYEVLRGYLHSLKGKNIIFDGFPRNVKQTIGAQKILKDLGEEISAFIYFDVPEKEIISRLKQRRQCEKCGKIYGKNLVPQKRGFCDKDKGKLVLRSDDKPAVIEHRFHVYHTETAPIIEDAAKMYPVFRVSGVGSPRAVFKRVERLLSLLK